MCSLLECGQLLYFIWSHWFKYVLACLAQRMAAPYSVVSLLSWSTYARLIKEFLRKTNLSMSFLFKVSFGLCCLQNGIQNLKFSRWESNIFLQPHLLLDSLIHSPCIPAILCFCLLYKYPCPFFSFLHKKFPLLKGLLPFIHASLQDGHVCQNWARDWELNVKQDR